MKKKFKKKRIKVAIDSPAAAGAGTVAKLISKEYNLFYLDTGKIYRFIANLKFSRKEKYNFNNIKKRIKNLKPKELINKKLLSEKVALEAANISKNKSIRKLVHKFRKMSFKNNFEQ